MYTTKKIITYVVVKKYGATTTYTSIPLHI
jgi:hypothetical protein